MCKEPRLNAVLSSPRTLSTTPPQKSDVIDLNSMYALVLGLLLVLGLSGDTSGMCGESRQQIESHIGSSEGLSHRRETPLLPSP